MVIFKGSVLLLCLCCVHPKHERQLAFGSTQFRNEVGKGYVRFILLILVYTVLTTATHCSYRSVDISLNNGLVLEVKLLPALAQYFAVVILEMLQSHQGCKVHNYH